jgi:5-methylcytosine-specific restriction endonuclease McrA
MIGKNTEPLSDSHKLNISKATKGKNHPFYGKRLSEEHREKMRKPKTKEHRKKLSIAAKRRFKNEENHPGYKGGVKKLDIPLYNTYAIQISYAEEIRRSPENFEHLQVKCAYCGIWFTPTTRSVHGRIRALNVRKKGELRFYCSENCKITCPIYRVHKFPKGFRKASSREVDPLIRQMCFKRDNWECQICGKNINEVQLHCHHIEGYTQNPGLGNDIGNVITLCKKCHKEVHKLPGCNYYDLRCKAGSEE